MLHAGEERVAPGGVGNGLDQPHLRARLHQPGEAGHRRAGHQAVRVQHDHERVFVAVDLAELRDVARLAADILLAPPVADARQGRVRRRPGLDAGEFMLLHGGDGAVAGVREDEDVDVVRALPRQRAGHDPQPREHRHRILGVDRHDGRRPPRPPGQGAAALGGVLQGGGRPVAEEVGDEAVEVLPGGEGLPAHHQGKGDEERRRQGVHRRIGEGGEPREGSGGGEARQGQGEAPQGEGAGRSVPRFVQGGGVRVAVRKGAVGHGRGYSTEAGMRRANRAGAVGRNDRRRAKTPHLRRCRKPTDRSPHAAATMRAMPRIGRPV